ncbi:MAG: efflux RND transporter permease subunit [Candidatus Obscuribacterales bacterium]|nr:efflux RND transporter permease subunit [Candidatus Obscuribacterales bacterium]
MWIVELALRKPHTFIVMAITIVIFGLISITRMAIDIFPPINIPIVSVAWTYNGMSPFFMENLITTVTERALTSTINGIQRMESVTLSGMSVIKLYLKKGTPVGEDVSQATSVCTAILRQLPRGINPPFVTATSATDVPVLQLGIQSDTLSESQLFDIANNLVRSQLATVQGAKIPFPYGGKYRQVVVDLDPKALFSYGVSASDIVNVLKNQNVIGPSGTAKMGEREYVVVLNNIQSKIEDLNNVPVKTDSSGNAGKNGAVVFLRDVANVHDGYQAQTNIVNINGKRSVLFNVLKNGDASTLTVVGRLKAALPRLRNLVPPECQINVLTDQSIFVRECVEEVIREAATAAGLTAIMILALLGSWRSTLIVATSIPLAILSALIGMACFGQTINSMTLGGLALAVGMLVDDATVEIENVHRNMAMGKDIETAILDGAKQVAMPALVSTFSICIVFVPLLFLTEPSRSLFVPLGLAVTCAMLASYGLSRTLVPLMSKALLGKEHHGPDSVPKKQLHGIQGFFTSIHLFIDRHFEGAREHYKGALTWALNTPKVAVAMFLGLYALSFCLLPFIGYDYFPAIDAGQVRLHISAPAGTRVEETERIFSRIEGAIRKTIPASEVESIIDNIGLPVSGLNYALSDSQTVSEADGEILLSLNDTRKYSTQEYQRILRDMIKNQFPEVRLYFQPADIVTQILNAGLPAPIDIKIIGLNREKNYEIAKDLKNQVEKISGAVDVCIHQVAHAPYIKWEVDRTRALEMGVTQKDISNSFLVNLSSSFQTNPNFWLDPKTRINYNLSVQTPQREIASLDDLRFMSITPSVKRQPVEQPPVLTNVANFTRSVTPAVVNHVSVLPVYDIYVSCQSRDLGSLSEDLHKITDPLQKKLPHGTFLRVAGQVLSMEFAFIALLAGLVFAIILVYLLLVVNFQSWTDPLIILMAVPGALSGIMWSLFVTQTTFTIPALMGAIMTIGVASANSILMVTFAKEQLAEGFDSYNAALNAGYQRFRPVIMTATAMIIGMIPMAIGSGEGGSQNAPIGRAVIGGLAVATFSTLFFVPLIFSLSRRRKAAHKE